MNIRIGSHIDKVVEMSLWKCEKCTIYYIQHWGMGIGYTESQPELSNWKK